MIQDKDFNKQIGGSKGRTISETARSVPAGGRGVRD